MRGNLRSAVLGAIIGVTVAVVLVVGGCGSSGASIAYRQVDRTGKPGLSVMFLRDPKIQNAFNLLSPDGDRFNLDTNAASAVKAEYTKVITAFAALACATVGVTGQNLKPFGQTCPNVNLSTGPASQAFQDWVVANLIPIFEGQYLPDVLRLDTVTDISNNWLLKYSFDYPNNSNPLLCRASPKMFCGGRILGEDVLRFNFSQLFFGAADAATASLATVRDDGTTSASTLTTTFPYLEVPN